MLLSAFNCYLTPKYRGASILQVYNGKFYKNFDKSLKIALEFQCFDLSKWHA